MSERERLEAQIAEAQARLEVLRIADEEQIASQEINEQALADGYKGSPPPGEWVQSSDAEIQLDGVSTTD
jgi:hypothetical protein